MIIQNGSPQISLDELTLFPFDDHSIPFQHGVELCLASREDRRNRTATSRTTIVVGLGEEEAPDSNNVVYYGSVHKVGDELWMWYLGQGSDEEWFQRVCLARSKDGYNWEKPHLGLVEYRGSRDNNLVDLSQGQIPIVACVVFHDPDDPDPSRRFKMAFESKKKYTALVAVAYSADGLVWRESPNNPVGSSFEMSGGTIFNGCYYLTGHDGSFPGPRRQFVTYVSYDFEHWSEAPCLGLPRGDRRFQDWGRNSGEQVHMGAGLWNRGNVIIGFYGQWHGHPSNDRELLTMDLGLAVSNDGLHYREPIPDYPIVSAAEDGVYDPPRGNAWVKFPALMQGQGFENVGDETLFWYAPWPEVRSDGVRVASWHRDRLGYFQAFLKGESRPDRGYHCVSAPVDLEGRAARVLVNVDGISEYSHVSVEVLDEQFNPLVGYTKDVFIGPRASGLRQPVQWRDRDLIEPVDGRVRIRASIEGIRPEDVRLYAIYLETA